MSHEARLAQLGITLPSAPPPMASYVPSRRDGSQLFISGQLPFRPDGSVVTGRLDDGIDIETAASAAQLCALQWLAQIRAAAGSLDRLHQVIKITGFVASAPGFTSQPRVVNGASDFLVHVLGDAGRHARSAVGVAALPLGACVEVEAIVALDSSR